MTFAYPLAFVFPALFLGLILFRTRLQKGVAYPRIELMKGIKPSWRLRLRKPLLSILSILAIGLLSIAAARPQIVTVVTEPSQSRNVVVAIDISKSMAEVDFLVGNRYVSRMLGVKSVLSEFARNRTKDRLGVVVFGANAYVQAPLTLDHQLVAQLVDRLDVGLAGDGTALGDGLGLALKRIIDLPGRSKAVILMTDGVSNAGQVNPIKAAKFAKDLGVKVHTIGIGSSESDASSPGAFLFPPFMQQRRAEFDEETLRKIADITGGVYFNANSSKGLEDIYKEIDKLEESQTKDPSKEIPRELFVEYAMYGLLCYLGYVVLSSTIFLKLP